MIYIVLADFIKLLITWVGLTLIGFLVTKYGLTYRKHQFYNGRLIWLLAVIMLLPAGISPLLSAVGSVAYVSYLLAVYVGYVIYMPTRIHWATKD